MTSFKAYLSDNNVKGIDDILIDAFDNFGASIVQLSLIPPVPPAPVAILPMLIAPTTLASVIVSAVIAKTGGNPSSASGLMMLMLDAETDINTFFITPMLINAAGMNILPTPIPPVPLAPIMPVALISKVSQANAKLFAKSLLEWTAGFVTGDPRCPGAISVMI